MNAELRGWFCLLISAVHSGGGEYISALLFSVAAVVNFVIYVREEE